MDEEALLQEIVALRGQMGDEGEEDDDDDDDIREGGERGTGRASTSGVQFQQQSDDDSSEDERENRNTVGNVPLKQWYKDEEHIGYDRDGRKLMKVR
jgi:ribosome biogenesis protein ERB1